MNGFLRELCSWLNSNRTGRKILFARNLTTGRQLLRMAAAHGTPAVNVQACSVSSYINETAGPELFRKGMRRIDSVTASMALRDQMERSGDAFTTLGVVELTTAESVLPLLNELERNQVKPEKLAEIGEPLLGQLWKNYLGWLHEHGYANATEILDAAVIPDSVSYAVLSNLPLSQMEQEFLIRIPADRLTVIHVATPEGEQIPRNMRYQKDSPVSGKKSEPDCVACQDIGSEIRAAFQYLIENEIPAEDAVIVCPDAAYGLRVEEEGKLLGINVNSAFGMPASMTNTSQLLSCLAEWATSNYDAESLRPVLVSAGMALYDEQGKIYMNGQELLRIFRKDAVGWGRERWQKLAESEKPRHAEAGRLMTAWIDFFETKAGTVRDSAARLNVLLNRCMARGPENEMFLKLADEISRLYTGSMDPVDYLNLLNTAASSQTIGARTTDEPGRAYCCSYESALYIDRGHFIMLGMSWDVFNRLSAEFPLLHDNEKEMLSPYLRLAGDGAHDKRYAVREFLANREDAKVLFSRARMDRVGGEEIMAASVFADAARKYPGSSAPEVNILERRALTGLDAHMKAGYYCEDNETEQDPGREELWEQAFSSRVWSATALETAYGCPRRFMFRNQMGLNKEDPEGLEQYSQGWLGGSTRGDLIHKVLQRYFDAIKPRLDQPDVALLNRLVDEAVEEWKVKVPVPSNLKDLTPEINDIRDLVRQAARMHAGEKGRETVGTEVGFGFDTPMKFTFGSHTIGMNGSIDRVDRTTDGYEIIDYKSGAAYRFKRDFDHKLQYYLYTLAWEKMHPDQPVRKAHYYLLDSPGGIECVPVNMTEEVRQAMYEKLTYLLDLLADVKTAVTPACLVGLSREEAEITPVTLDSCPSYCPFMDICREIQTGQIRLDFETAAEGGEEADDE